MRLPVIYFAIISAARSLSKVAFDSFIRDSIAFDLSEDPVKLLISLDAGLESQLSESRLIQIAGSSRAPEWMTEGDKLRLRRRGLHFIDLTGAEEILGGQRLIEKGSENEGTLSCL
jgi:hypothetical protein